MSSLVKRLLQSFIQKNKLEKNIALKQEKNQKNIIIKIYKIKYKEMKLIKKNAPTSHGLLT